MRRAVVACLALALAFTGLVAQPAAAATYKTLNGKGSYISKDFRLDPGVYRLDFSFYGETNDYVRVYLRSEIYGDVDLVADDVAPSGSTRRIVGSDGEALWLDVDVADDVRWTATFAPESLPNNGVKSFSTSGHGMSTSDLYVLEKGTYSYTASYSGNTYDGQPGAVELVAVDATAGKGHILVEAKASSKGTKTGTFTIKERAYFWIDAYAWPSATWKVKAKLLKKMTTSPTPKISGTAKVGKTLTAKPGTWKPSGVKLGYQWYRDGKKISGATKSTYKVSKSDKGKRITVKVTGSKSGYISVTKTSGKTSKVT
ncbi:hypothetical protein [Tessaracoccus caeni]|uniref:hypothetical protein n=1 Tax=Tessaracoccus caeni TaxID=3031239 RepID=UPI0023DAE2D3|nr:hypothetical protein [Tessaracoccus caeni]MDF1488876.1 hypothetical protein [Tessaracoccus caeni]